jgi:hypothetical protein
MRDEESPASGIVREAVGPNADPDPADGRRSSGPNQATVFSPRFDVTMRSCPGATSAPATAVRSPIEPMYFCAAMSMTSTASFAVWAT